MTALKDSIEQLWPGERLPDLPNPAEGLGAPPGFRPRSTPAEIKAEQTTRVAREATEAEAEARQTKVARLRRMRLEKEEAEQAAAAALPRKRKRS